MKKILVSALMATAMFSAQAEDEIAEVAKTSFSGIYFGGGFHFMTFQDYADYETATEPADMENSTKARLGGTILLGIGKKFESIPFYLALEAGLDFAPNTELYAKDKADISRVKYMRVAANGTSYTDGVDDTPWAQANVNIIDNALLQLLPDHTGPVAAPEAATYAKVESSDQYSLKIRRNGANPSIGVRIAWASDFLKSLAYVKVAAYFTKDRFRYVGHKYLCHTGELLDGTAANPHIWSTLAVSEANSEPIADFLEVKETHEFFNSKVTPEITVGIEKRMGNIGMRLEGGYLLPSSTKHSTSPQGYEFNFKKKGSCVVRLLGVWNLNLFK